MLQTRLARLSLVLLCLVYSQRAFPQATFGSILGTVTDTSGSVVPDAVIEVRNQGTGVVRQAKTDERGIYQLLNLVPGNYTVQIEAKGFSRFENRDVVMGSLRALRIDAQLTVATAETVISVQSAAPVIETESPTISSVRTTQQMQDMPLNLRTLQGLTGDSGTWAYVNVTPTGAGRGVTMSLGGSRASMLDVNVDGISTRSPTFGNLAPADPGLDAIQEVRFEYVNNKAEFAEMANISLVTRSGGNDLHGRFAWDLGNSLLNARTFFSVTNPKANRNDLMATVSGPIIKNKLFFLALAEGQRFSGAGLVNPSVPTLKMRQGDFSDLLALQPAVVVRDPYTNQPFPNNQIPRNMLYDGAVRYQDRFYPQPNFGAPQSFVTNFRKEYPQRFRQEHVDARIDYYVKPKHMVYGRLTYQRSKTPFIEGNFPPETIGYREQVRNDRNVAMSYTWTVSPTTINEFKAGYSRDYNPRQGPVDGREIVTMLGITGLPDQIATFKNLPNVSIAGFTAPSQTAGSGPAGDVLQITDQLSWIRGRHTFKAGVDFAPQHSNTLPGPNFGTYPFTNRFTGFAYSDFLLGLPTTSSRAFAAPSVTTYYYYLNGFIQDDFKVSPTLSLSYGVRYEFNSPSVDRFDSLYNFDPSTGGLVVPTQASLAKVLPIFPKEIPIATADQAGYPTRSLSRPDKNNFLPRFGFAWRPGSDNRTVLRGGYGFFNDSLTAQHAAILYGGPYAGSESFTNSITNGVPLLTLQRPFLNQGTPSTTVGNVVANGMALNLRNPTGQQWSLTVERELAGRVGVRISYIGTRTTGLLYSRNLNQPAASLEAFNQNRRPYPRYQNIFMQENGGTHTYNALSVEVERKWFNGLSFQGAWTWTKSLTDIDDWAAAAESGTRIENSYDRRRERGNTSFLPRHRGILNLIWQLPIGAGKPLLNNKGVLNAIVGGWQLSATFMSQTGLFFSPTFSGADPSNTNTIGGRPDRIRDGNLPADQRTIDRWFDPTAFAVPPRGRFGNSGTNIMEGPGRYSLASGLFKDFALTERLTLRAQGSFVNVTNHPNFALPTADISQPTTVGTIRAVEGADTNLSSRRAGLVGLRLSF